MKSIQLEISGMTCQLRARAVEKSIRSLPGAKDASVDHAAGRGAARVDETVSPRDVIDAIEDAGYRARVIEEQKAPEPRRRKSNSAGEAFDLLVIGTGAAGMAAAIRGAELGRRVGIVEVGTVGGTCVNVGCIPSRNLLAAAEAYRSARAGFPGVESCEPTLDWLAIRTQKRRILDLLRDAKYLDVLAAHASRGWTTSMHSPARPSWSSMRFRNP